MIRLRPKVKIVIYDLDGTIKESVDLTNELKTAGLEMLAAALRTASSDCKIKYMAWGKSDTANSPDQTTLVDEFGRKQVTEQESGGDGVNTTTVYVAPYEGIEYTIEELGWFAGPNATSAKDSGILLARVLYSRAKTGAESLQIVRTDAFLEVTP